MKTTLITILILLLTGAVAGPLMAQEAAVRGIPQPQVPCPHPITQTIKAPPPSPPTLDPADFNGALGTAVAGSVWNQTAPDKGFGHTFHFPFPGKECCLMTKGTLIVTVKALVSGPAGSSTTANDWVQLVQNGASVPGSGQQPFASGATLGQQAVVTINVPANILATGRVSFYVQDDSAVVSAELRLTGCCLK